MMDNGIETTCEKRLNPFKVAFLLFGPILTLVALGFYISRNGFEWTDLALFAVFYVLTGISITAGYHRYYAHRAYESHRIVQYVLLFFGTAALQTPVLDWASDHRYHHRHVDHAGDPYDISRGFFYAHMGWIFYDDVFEGKKWSRPFQNVRDLKKDRLLRLQQKYYWPVAIVLCFGLPTLIGALYGRPGAGLLWGGILRVLFTHHCVYLINSAAHFFGSRPYSTRHSARDNGWLALVSFGEGYHNFHHSFGSDYRNGIAWFHWDPTKWLIKGLSWIGMTSGLRVTAPETIAQVRHGQRDREIEAEGIAPTAPELSF